MKKLIVVVCLALFCSRANAVPLDIDIGPVTLMLPLQSVSASYLFDLVNEDSLVGGETPFLETSDLTLSIGAVTSFDADRNATPYLSGDLKMPEKFFGERLSFGAFAGYDFNNKEPIAGIKVNVNIFKLGDDE